MAPALKSLPDPPTPAHLCLHCTSSLCEGGKAEPRGGSPGGEVLPVKPRGWESCLQEGHGDVKWGQGRHRGETETPEQSW